MLLTIFPMLYFISRWLFCNYQFVLLNPFTFFMQSFNFATLRPPSFKTDLLSHFGSSTDLLYGPQKRAEHLYSLLSVKQWWQKFTHGVPQNIEILLMNPRSPCLGHSNFQKWWLLPLPRFLLSLLGFGLESTNNPTPRTPTALGLLPQIAKN